MKSKIKRTLGLFNVVITVLALCVSTARASRAEVISSYDVDARLVKSTRTIEVTETITIDFGKARRHGIERVFGQAQQVTVKKVSDKSGSAYKTSTTSNLGKTYLRIGSPDKQVTGTHTYRIQYRLGGAIKDDGTLNWSPTGHNWSQKISRFDLKLHSDGPLPKALTARAKTARSIDIGKDSAFRVIETAIQPGEGVDVICPLGEVYAGRPVNSPKPSTAAAAAAAASALASLDASSKLDSMPIFIVLLMFIPALLATVCGAIATASCSCSSEWSCKCPVSCPCVARHRHGKRNRFGSSFASPYYDNTENDWSSSSSSSSSSSTSSDCGSSDSGSSSGSDGGGGSW
ncbi:MAG: DUF2207 domain-containing protein [Candidatus Obscuribacterales bacterium]|nr:DUF2207 domain-containing protein [Candidatus Obscuribacterales bacterium]